MNNDLSVVPITPNLGFEIKKQEIKTKIIERLTELKLLDGKFKNNQEVLLLICNITEFLVQDKKINKKELVLDIFTSI